MSGCKIVQINLMNQIKTLCMLINSIQISNTYNHIFIHRSSETNTEYIESSKFLYMDYISRDLIL